MARYISSQVIFQQQDHFYQPNFWLIKKKIFFRDIQNIKGTAKGKIPYKY